MLVLGFDRCEVVKLGMKALIVPHHSHSRVASSTWGAVRPGARARISSGLWRPLIASAIALSQESPTVPVEAMMPSSAIRSV